MRQNYNKKAIIICEKCQETGEITEEYALVRNAGIFMLPAGNPSKR